MVIPSYGYTDIDGASMVTGTVSQHTPCVDTKPHSYEARYDNIRGKKKWIGDICTKCGDFLRR